MQRLELLSLKHAVQIQDTSFIYLFHKGDWDVDLFVTGWF